MSEIRVSVEQALAWRLRRQFLAIDENRTDPGAASISGRLGGVQAQVASAAELAVGLRQRRPVSGEVASALADGRLLKTWAMRGTLHLLPPAEASSYLSVVASARTWEKPVWQRNFGASPEDIRALGDAVSMALDGVSFTREELVSRILANGHFAEMAQQLRSGWGALLKPLAWQGVLCHGPKQGAKVTFARPVDVAPGWQPIPEPDEGAPHVIAAYLGAYGPATPEAFDNWLTRKSLRKTTVRRWFAEMGDALTEVDVAGRRAYLPTEHVEGLLNTPPSKALRLLGPFDQYVLGPGTGDTDLLPTEHRAAVSRAAGWISPVVLSGGRIVGTWERQHDTVTVSLFPGVPEPASKLLRAEAARIAAASDADKLTVRLG